MEERIRELCIRESNTDHLDFDRDPEYQAYYTQAQALWEGGEMPEAIYHLLEAGNFFSFAQGFRLGLALAGWAQTG